LCLSVFLALVDNTIVNVALPLDQQAAPRNDQRTCSGSSTLIPSSSRRCCWWGGAWGDRYGRKGALQIGLVAFAGFSAFAGLSGSTPRADRGARP